MNNDFNEYLFSNSIEFINYEIKNFILNCEFYVKYKNLY